MKKTDVRRQNMRMFAAGFCFPETQIRMSGSNPAAVRVIVHGKVQRVFFRLSTRNEARSLGLTGTVKNLHGGASVEVIAEGEKERLEDLIKYLRHGPDRAQVDNLDIEWIEYTGTFSQFDVLY